MIKNEDINKLCKLVLKKYYPYIKNMYKYLSFQSFYESPNISLQLFNDFIRTTNTVDDKTLKSTDIEMKFMACISASKFKKMKKEGEYIFFIITCRQGPYSILVYGNNNQAC